MELLLFINTLFEIGKKLHSSECGFCSLGSWSYSKEWVKLGTKNMWHRSREVKCQLGDTPGI